LIFSYNGRRYPEYLKKGNASQYITPIAKQFCKGKGLDVGPGKWPLPGAIPHELTDGKRAEDLPEGKFGYIFSSHCLEHLVNPIETLEHWKTRLKTNGVLFLYLPHPDMEYWLPQNCRKHLHSWYPEQIRKILEDLGFKDVLVSERDLAWGFSAVGFNQEERVSLDSVPRKKETEEFLSERMDAILQNPDLTKLYKEFGMSIFRRSSVFHGLEKFLRDNNISGKTCFEIGTFHGITAVVLSRFFDKVVTVDIIDNPYRQQVVDTLGIRNIEFLTIKDNNEKARIAEKLDFDFCHMDGNHRKDTLSDFELVKKCGRVLFHEYWKEQPVVWDLVNSLDKVVKAPPLAYWNVR
jgi:SAM-dependent methyltransferase